jgi:hypothetical protein
MNNWQYPRLRGCASSSNKSTWASDTRIKAFFEYGFEFAEIFDNEITNFMVNF